MKKKHWIVVLTVICVLLGGYLIYDSNFPYASPIEYPNSTEIKEHKILKYDGQSEVELENQLEEIMNYIKTAKPTRKMSVSERPGVSPYYYIAIETEKQSYSYCIYTENSKVYVEMHYFGVYTINEKVLDLFS